MARKAKVRVFACDLCGGRWNQPVGIHLPGGASKGPAWCPVNAREVTTRPVRRKGAR